ncbi:MAG TPA: hypothetical protein VGH00_02205 [Chthoniobacterales bacterium]
MAEVDRPLRGRCQNECGSAVTYCHRAAERSIHLGREQLLDLAVTDRSIRLARERSDGTILANHRTPEGWSSG